jgi:hypothetical protein
MKLGLTIGYSGAEMRLPLKRILRAEELGYGPQKATAQTRSRRSHLLRLIQDVSASALA